jgi:hypothetical protein
MKRVENKEKESQSNTKRVIMQNEDGTITYLEGYDLTMWEKVMSDLVALGFVHGGQGQKELKQIKWKKAGSLKNIDTTPKT